MKPDVIVTWPTSMDYPWWRWQMKVHREKFDKIFVVFHNQGVPNFKRWLVHNFKEATFIDMPEPGVCWRHNSINLALQLSKNPWVWFTEMDFFVKEDYFFVKMFEEAEKGDGAGFRQGIRYHPACLLVKRKAMDKTDCFFDPAYLFGDAGNVLIEAHLDHFVFFTWQLDKVAKIKTLKKIGLKDGEDFYHMEDLTHNYDRVKVGNIDEQHRVKDFLIYNAISRTIPVPISKKWIEITYVAEYLLSPLGKFLNR